MKHTLAQTGWALSWIWFLSYISHAKLFPFESWIDIPVIFTAVAVYLLGIIYLARTVD